MASRRRGRRTPVQWLPVIGTTVAEQASRNFKLFNLIVQNDGSTVTTVLPITFDRPIDLTAASAATTSLADIVGSSYTLKRIVGKCYAGFLPPATQDPAVDIVVVGCGFFVAKADTTNPDIPAMTADAFDVLNENNMLEPWIWRRVWQFGNPTSNYGITWPSSSAWGGSVMDGPHIDSRVKRRIADDDRLWFAASACSLFEQDERDPVTVGVTLDYRLLGTLKKNRNQSAF